MSDVSIGNDHATVPKRTVGDNVRKFFIGVLKKIPLFAAIILFIVIYTKFAGSENSITGVIILMGFLMLLPSDLGYKPWQASLSIFFMFCVIAIAPEFSKGNIWIAAAVNFAVYSATMIFTAKNIIGMAYMPFGMGYMFNQGYTVEGDLLMTRICSLVVASAIIAVLYYITHRKRTHDATYKTLFTDLSINKVKTQWYIKLVLTLVIATFFANMFNFKRTMWIDICIFSIMIMPSEKTFKERIKWRIPATIVGGVILFSIVHSYVPIRYQTLTVLLAGLMSMCFNSYFMKTVFNSFSALSMAAVLFPPDEAIFLRVAANCLGFGIAIASTYLFKFIFRNCDSIEDTVLEPPTIDESEEMSVEEVAEEIDLIDGEEREDFSKINKKSY